ncbi:MAG TPA: hypothetical protein VFE33_13595 [Thermoanaerobaculia bacterium]|nr:hypothetical protein [Thermoanaerobaculia bacterium]
MTDQEKKTVDVDGLEVTELEETDLEDVAGGTFDPVTNNSCPTNVSCGLNAN